MQDAPLPERQSIAAEAIRQLCLQAAIAAYEEAGFNGLCAEGRWECAMEAIRRINLANVPLVAEQAPGGIVL